MAQNNNLNWWRNKLPTLKQLKSWVILSSPIWLTILFSFVLQFTVIARADLVKAWLESFGWLAVLIYAVIQSVSIIIAPIGGSFIRIAMLSVFGAFPGVLIVYLVSTPAFFVNFYLAKRYGRRIVRKLVGDKGIERIDHIAADAGIEAVWVLAIFQNTYFDFISYALGLTKMSYKTFATVNIIGGIPSAAISYFILVYAPDFITAIFFMHVMAAIFIGFSIFYHHWRKKHRNI